MRNAHVVAGLMTSVTVTLFFLDMALSACSSSVPGTSPCLPEPLQIHPDKVVVASAVTVSSAPFNCQGTYPAGKVYQLTLSFVGRSAPIDLGSFPVNADGSFRAIVPIPANASPGEAYIIVHGSPFDYCHDSIGQSCAGYTARLTILASG